MILIYVCLLLLSITSAWTAEPYTPVKQDEIDQTWRWRIYNEFKGKGLRSIAQDSTGAMWFGVEDGVVHYDGLTWTSFDETDGLPNGPINAICTGIDGRVYVASDAGIGYWFGGKWSHIFPQKEGFYWPVDDLEVDRRGRIWAATPWGAVRLDAGQAVVYTSSEMAAVLRSLVPGVKIEEVPQDMTFLHPRNARQMARNIGSGNADVGIVIVKGGWLGILRGEHPVTIWHVAENSPADSAGIVPGDLVMAVDQRREVQQRLFVGEEGSLVELQLFRPSLKDTFTVSLVRKQVPGWVRDWHVYDVMFCREGGVWLGLWDGQVVHFYPDAPNPQWQMWSEKDGLPLQYGPRLYEDKNATIWRVTNYGGGVYRFQDKKWSQVMDVPLVFGSPITGIGESEDGWLFLGGGELAAYKDGQWKMPHVGFSHTKDALPNHRNRLLVTNDQALWLAGLGQGLARLNLDPVRGQMYPELKYQADHALTGTWYVTQDSGVVRQMNGVWTRFDHRDGLMDTPLSVVMTSQGVVWASGSHKNIAATAHFDGERWHTQTYPRLSRMISWKSVFVDSKDRVWFGAYHYNDKLGQIGGVLCFDGSTWVHYEPPEALDVVYAIGETMDGQIWAGTHELQYFDGQMWHIDKTISDVWVHSILGAKDGSLWIGTRLKGIWHREGETWRQYSQKDGLEGNFFESLIETEDGNIWASGSLGIYRFDGQSWTPDILPDELYGEIKIDSKGNVRTVSTEWGTAVVELEKLPPALSITSYVEEVTQPGNTLISWQGQDRWHDTAVSELQYAWRLNEGKWSRYARENEHIFLGLPDGAYHFQVQARDKAFNKSDVVTVSFVVLPPIWKQAWFMGILTGLGLVILWQSGRVVRRNRQLHLANMQLEQVSEQLQANLDILRTLVDTVPIPLYLQDKDQVFTDCNKAFADLFGMLPKDILGKHQTQIWSSDVAQIEADTTRTIISTQKMQHYEIEMDGQAGVKKKFVVTKAPLYEYDRDFDGVVAAIFDITERLRIEEMARELERDLVVVQTAGAAAHKINQPLTVIIGMVDLLLQGYETSDDEVTDALMAIRQAGLSIEAIVKAMQTVKAYRTEKYVGNMDIVSFDGEREIDG